MRSVYFLWIGIKTLGNERGSGNENGINHAYLHFTSQASFNGSYEASHRHLSSSFGMRRLFSVSRQHIFN